MINKDKDLSMEFSEEVPENWQVKRLGAFGTFQKGGGISKSDLTEDGFDAILYGDIYTKYNVVATKIVNKIPAKIAEGSKKLEYDDLLFTGSGETREEIGKCVVFHGKNNAFAGGDLLILKQDKYDGLFLSYALNSELAVFQKAKTATGDIVVHTYASKLKNIYIPIPSSVSEQKAIANYLSQACAKIEESIHKKQQQLNKLTQYFFTKIDELLTSKNFEGKGKEISLEEGFIKRTIPPSWKVDRLRDVAIINDQSLGTNTPDDYLIKYLDISNVNKYGIVDKGEIEELLFEEAPSRAKRVVEKYDTVISSVRTNLQAVAFIDFDLENLICSTGFFVCRPRFPSQIRNKFLYYFLLTSYSKDYFFSRSTGVSYPAINDYKFGSIPVFIPPVEKQDEIIAYLDKLKHKVEAVSDNIRDQITKLNNYKKSLIHECVTGKKRVYNEEEKQNPSVYAE